MSARIAKVRAERRRRRRVLATLVIVVLAGAGGSLGVALSPLADVQRIEVVAVDGTGAPLDVDAIGEASGVELGEPLALLTAQDAEAELEALPAIRRATVSVSWDGEVRIAVARRRPVAQITLDGGSVLLLDDGVVAEVGERFVDIVDGDRLLPLDVDASVTPGGSSRPEIDRAIRAVSDMPADLRGRIRRGRVDENGELAFELRRGGLLLWGDGGRVARKGLAARAALGGQVDLDGLCSLDVRVPSQVTITRAGPSCRLEPNTATPIG